MVDGRFHIGVIRTDGSEERLLEDRIGRRATTVQEHEQLTPPATTGRDDEDLVQITMHELAVECEADDRRAAWGLVAAPRISQRDPRREGDE